MSKNKVVETSREAFYSLDPEKINEIHKRIIEGLRLIKKGTYEDLAISLKLEPQRVWRRLSELHKMGAIERTGERKKMASGRSGFEWQLTAKVPQTEKAIPGKSVADYSRSSIQPKFTQERLF